MCESYVVQTSDSKKEKKKKQVQKSVKNLISMINFLVKPVNSAYNMCLPNILANRTIIFLFYLYWIITQQNTIYFAVASSQYR